MYVETPQTIQPQGLCLTQVSIWEWVKSRFKIISSNSLLFELSNLYFAVFHDSAGKESGWNAGDLGSIPGLGRFPGEGKGYPLQYSGLACVAKSWT